MNNITIKEERISAEEYIDFLKRTDLGSQYPKERFNERIKKLVKNVNISLVARNDNGVIVGVIARTSTGYSGRISAILHAMLSLLFTHFRPSAASTSSRAEKKI